MFFLRVENIAGKGEKAGYQHFLLFPPCFQKTSFKGLLKVGIDWKGLNPKVIYMLKAHLNLNHSI